MSARRIDPQSRKAPSSGDASLRVDADGRSRVYRLSKVGMWRLGRAEDCDILLADTHASRLHATIHRDANGVYHFVEAGSRNGTLLNGRQLAASSILCDGDRIRIGAIDLLFRLEGPAIVSAATVEAATEFHFSRELVTVMVLDICGYTGLAQALGEERVSALMSDFFRIGGELTARRQCWAQKYVGDAVMAVWRHPDQTVDLEEFCDYLDLVADFTQLTDLLTVKFALPAPLRFGGALNTGYAATGNMGSATTADFTAMGEAVIKAFRLEAGTRDLRCDFLISSETMRMVQPSLPPQSCPSPLHVMLKGFDAPEPVHAFNFAQLSAFAKTGRSAI